MRNIELEDDDFIEPNVTFTNERFPQSKIYPEAFLRTIVRKGLSIGANATILPDVLDELNDRGRCRDNPLGSAQCDCSR